MDRPQTVPLTAETIACWAEQQPDHIALLAEGRAPLSYAALVGQADHVRLALGANGITPSHRVALCIEDRPSLALCLVGLLFHGAAAIPIDPARPVAEVTSHLQALRADAVLCCTGESVSAKSAGTALGLPLIEFVRSDSDIAIHFDDVHTSDPPPNTELDPEGWALLLATSGTTGRKIVPRTQAAQAFNYDRKARWLGLGSADRCLNVMPLYLAQGINDGLMVPLYSGGSSIIASGTEPEAFFSCVDRFKPTWYTAVYTFYRAVLQQAAQYEDVVRNASFSFFQTGGMQFPLDDAAKFEALFDAPLISAYGMTETGWVACLPLPPKQRKAGTVGQQVIDEIRVIDDQGGDVPMGQPGEIVVRGPGVATGYLDSPAAEAESFMDGWFRTGDLGFFDADGFLTLVGRKKEIINRGSEKISPWEVEQVLSAHPNIEDIAVFGEPHESLGEIVAAAVIFKEDQGTASRQELTSYALDRLNRGKVPRQIYAVTKIPKGAGGKPQRALLAEELAKRNEKETQAGSASAAVRADPNVPLLEVPLTALWKSALGVDTIGRDDRFVELGGTDAIAAELVASVRAVFGVELESACLGGDSGTVANMAALIARAKAEIS